MGISPISISKNNLIVHIVGGTTAVEQAPQNILSLTQRQDTNNKRQRRVGTIF